MFHLKALAVALVLGLGSQWCMTFGDCLPTAVKVVDAR
jgi:hypothetical protein